MKKIKLLIVEDNKILLKMMKQYFSNNKNIEITLEANDGIKAYETIINNLANIDVILLDLIMPNKDGTFVLERMRDECIYKNVIVISAFSQEEVIRMVCEYGIKYFMLKPFEFSDLENKIIETSKRIYKGSVIDASKNNLQKSIAKLLHELGVPSHIKGYQYIKESVELIYENPMLSRNITKCLYPEIGKIFDTSKSRVERSIRHAIEISWNRGDWELMEEIFGNSIDSNKSKPTNSEYIAAVVEKLEFDMLKIR